MKKKYYSAFFAGILISSCAYSQQISDDIASNEISEANLQKHVEYLASDKLEGRGTGSEGYRLAEIYVESIFQNANLLKICTGENGNQNYSQHVIMERVILEEKTKAIITRTGYQKAYGYGDNLILAHFGKLNNETLKGEVISVGDGIHEPQLNIDDYKNESIINKWVLMNESISNEILEKLPVSLKRTYRDVYTSLMARTEEARKKGAIGVIVAPSEQGMKYWKIREQAFREYYSLPVHRGPYRSAEIPIVLIDTTIFKELDMENSKSFFELKKYIKKEKTIAANNVIGMVKGTNNNDNYIIVGAHLDHLGKKDGKIYNGADDNASGVAGILELAKSISENPCENNVVFVAFAAEEIGSLGSCYFINNLPFDIKNIKAMLNFDMIGRSDGDTKELAIISMNFESDRLAAIIKNCQTEGETVDWAYMETFNRIHSGDHFPFVLMNIPGIWLFSGLHSDYHQTSDDSERIDYEFLYNNTKFAEKLLRKLDE